MIILTVALDEKLYAQSELSPFVICPVNDIRKITVNQGIGYGHDLSWIPWPTADVNRQNYSVWLHDELMGLSEVYRIR